MAKKGDGLADHQSLLVTCSLPGPGDMGGPVEPPREETAFTPVHKSPSLCPQRVRTPTTQENGHHSPFPHRTVDLSTHSSELISVRVCFFFYFSLHHLKFFLFFLLFFLVALDKPGWSQTQQTRASLLLWPKLELQMCHHIWQLFLFFFLPLWAPSPGPASPPSYSAPPLLPLFLPLSVSLPPSLLSAVWLYSSGCHGTYYIAHPRLVLSS